MKDYLTIGEVSQIKKISIKSLRYYEHIGILVPAKVNPENGYRYYSKEQLLTIDMIKFLSSMDIPLKDWHQYIDKNGFYLQELIQSSRDIVYKQLQTLQIRLHRLDIAARGLKDNEKYAAESGFYDRVLQARNILCYPISNPDSVIDFHKNLSILFDIADQYHASACYPSGMIMDYSPEQKTFYVYIEIFETLDGQPYFRHFPEHHYRCIRQPQKSIINAVNILPEYFKAHPYATVIESDCIISPVQFKPYPTELQFCDLA